MVKTSATEIKIKCGDCDFSVLVSEVLTKFPENKWEPTDSWVERKMSEGNIGVLTHQHIICDTCKDDEGNPEEIAILKLDFEMKKDAKLSYS